MAAINNSNHTHLSTEEPMYWPADRNKIPDLLDFFILNNIASHYADVVTSLDLSPDHTPVIATLNTYLIKKSSLPRLVSPKTNWELFGKHLNENLHLKAVQRLTSAIQEAAWISTPTAYEISSQVPNIPLHIRHLVAQKRRSRRRYQLSRNPIDKNTHNRLAQQLKRELASIRNTNFTSYITSDMAS